MKSCQVIASYKSILLRKVDFLLKSGFQVVAFFIPLEVWYLVIIVVNFVYKWPRQLFLGYHKIISDCTAWKLSKYGVFSGPYFLAFVINMEKYFVSLRIQPECGKIRTRKNSVFGHFSHSVGLYFWNIYPIGGLISLWVRGFTIFQSRAPKW